MPQVQVLFGIIQPQLAVRLILMIAVQLTPLAAPTLPTSSPTTMVTVGSALMVMLILSSVGVILVMVLPLAL